MKPLIKVLIFILAVVLISHCEKNPIEQLPNPDDIVNIPDTAFLYSLITREIDTNGDSLISYREAEAVKKLVLGPDMWSHEYTDYKDLTGIEAFINLEDLRFSRSGRLIEIDLSKNTKLKIFRTGGFGMWPNDAPCGEKKKISSKFIGEPAPLKTLNISNCKQLTSILVQHSSLESLDISNNTALTCIDIMYNGITNLDISNNESLVFLNCGGNPLSYLDISNNTALTDINLQECYDLQKVCVWTMPFPPAGVDVIIDNSPNVYFTTDCSK